MSRSLTRQLVVRVTDDTYTALADDAAAHGRTVAQSVRFHLRSALIADGRSFGSGAKK